MSDDHFHYDQLMLNAHRGLIRNVLLKVLKDGLPGEHHFFIIFDTTHPETRISDRLKVQYPSEMTIVLQHQYSNLKVHEDRFEIQLSFNRIPELLVIPFKAITGFVDPSVPFGLQLAGDAAAGLENSIGMLVPGLPQSDMDERPSVFPQGEIPQSESPLSAVASSDENMDEEELMKPEAVVDFRESDETSVPSIFPASNSLRDVSDDGSVPDESDDAAIKEDEEEKNSGTVVQLDAFRKKSK